MAIHILGRPVRPIFKCPICQWKLNNLASPFAKDDLPPEPGDIAVCGACVTALRFDENLSPKPIELSALAEDVRKEVVAIQRSIWDQRKKKNPIIH
jgi:hypothetical protein